MSQLCIAPKMITVKFQHGCNMKFTYQINTQQLHICLKHPIKAVSNDTVAAQTQYKHSCSYCTELKCLLDSVAAKAAAARSSALQHAPQPVHLMSI